MFPDSCPDKIGIFVGLHEKPSRISEHFGFGENDFRDFEMFELKRHIKTPRAKSKNSGYFFFLP
jgi:hypothetical protein